MLTVHSLRMPKKNKKGKRREATAQSDDDFDDMMADDDFDDMTALLPLPASAVSAVVVAVAATAAAILPLQVPLPARS
jgi:hypothetical protein